MRRNVTFALGYRPAGAGLASRRLVVKRMPKAGDDTMPGASYDNSLGGTTDYVTVELKDNQMWQATLTDTLTAGGTTSVKVLNFNTGSLAFPGPSEGDFGIASMEDLSSSSDSSLNSSSSSASSQSSSSSSASSASSASSVNSSSSSPSSINSSSSSVSSINSSSSSSSVSSSSSSSVSSSSSS